MKKNFTIGLLASLMSCVQSCDKTQMEPAAAAPVIKSEEVTNQLQIVFAKALSKTLKDDAALRKFLKTESLKMFDQDNDVLYQMIKDVRIDNGETFRERLAHNMTVDELASIEKQVPLLTIFVPTLPSGFSPATWQTDQELPKIAVRKLGSDRIPFYDENGVETVIPGNHIPGFPILVIKQNERVTTEANSLDISEQPTKPFYQSQQFAFSFTAPAFDGIHPVTATGTNSPARTVPKKTTKSGAGRPASYYGWFEPGNGASGLCQRVVKGYQIDTDNPNQLWQRDYVYYGLTPTTPKGRLINNYKEYIRTFQLTSQGITHMAGQSDDPNAPTVGSSAYSTTSAGQGAPSYWADGNYEFLIVLLRNPKDGTLPQRNIRFSATPDQLYNIITRRSFRNFGFGGAYYYTITAVTPNAGYGAPSLNIALNEWDLQNFGTAWNFQLFEENATVTHNETRSVTTEYAANFEFNPTFTFIVKAGFKFGASAKSTNTLTTTVQYTTGSTEMGEQTLYFSDPILTGGQMFTGSNGIITGDFTTYNLDLGGTSGYASMSVEPASVVPADNDLP